MRLFLDAHLSGPRLAGALRAAGHDVRAADEERSLDGWSDEELLSPATTEGRILVTFDVKDFPLILRRWAEGGRAHAGCMILVGLDHGAFGAVLRIIERELATNPDQEAWRDRACFAARQRRS